MALAVTWPPASVSGSDWPRFRGPSGGGVQEIGGAPAELNPSSNLRWKKETPEGTSSPIVVGKRVFLTGSRGDERLVLCLDSATGETLWIRSVQKSRQEVATAPSGPATPTVVADEERVYAFFSDFGLIAFSHDGEEQWRVPLGPFHSFHGVSSSLVTAEGRVVVVVDQLQDSFIAAYDCRTGAQAWRAGRQDGPIGGYSTPATRTSADGKVELIVSGPLEVVGYDVGTGQRLWSVVGVSNAPISVPVVSGNRVFVCEPSFDENPFKMSLLLPLDKNKDGKLSLAELEPQLRLYRVGKRVDEGWGNGDGQIEANELEKAFGGFVGGGGLAAVDIDGVGAQATAQVKWTYRKTVPQVPSLVLHRGLLFGVNDGGILTAFEPEKGEVVKRGRLGQGSKYYASPVAADGRLYLIDTEGKVAVVSAEAEWKVLATSDLAEPCYATPAIAGGRCFVRSERNLFCFGSDAQPKSLGPG
jgi:outer membrane protein assembly factor BamB